MALEKCGNITIRAFYKDKNATENEARYLFRQVALGVAALHKAGIYHRDLKPDNMQMTIPDGHVQLIDFGVSIMNDSPKRDFTGASGYNVPEILLDQSYRPSLMDVWSLAISIYRTRFNFKPFGGIID